MTPETYPIGSPPFSPGVYGLRNRKTGHVYIGQTRNLNRRFQEWRGLLRVKVGKCSARFMELARQSIPEDWEFLVLQHVGRDDRGTLDRLENQAIARLAARNPELLLNRQGNEPEGPPLTKGYPNERKSVVRASDGRALSHAEAGEILGVTTQAIKKRLRHLRSKGVVEVEVEKLRTRAT